MAHEVETGFTARTPAWHRLTPVTETTLTAKEALKQAGLDWRVDLTPSYMASPDGEEYVPVPDTYHVVRSSDHKSLGTVGSHYVPLQNEEAFAFLDNLTDTGLEYESAFSLRSGKIVAICALFPEEIVIGGEDAHRLYLVLSNNHDGRGAVKVAATPIRLECMNTLNLGLREAKRTWSAPHLVSLDGKIAEARGTLDLTYRYAEEFKVQAESLLSEKMVEDEFDTFLRSLTKDDAPRPQKAALEGIRRIYFDSPTQEGIRGTAWGALNAVGEFYDWERDIRGDEARVIGSLEGVAVKKRDKALALLTR